MIIRGLCVCILQSQETFLAGTDLDNVFDIVNEDFTITDLTGMKNFLGSINNLLNRYKTYNDLNLNLRTEVHVNLNTTIVGWSTLLNTTSHNVCDSDTGYADLVHSLHKLIQLVLTCDDNDFCKLRSQVGTMYGTLKKGPRYLEMAEGYVTGIALDENDEIIGYQFVSLGKMTDFIKKGDDPNTAWEKAKGQYGRVADAVKIIDPRKE